MFKKRPKVEITCEICHAKAKLYRYNHALLCSDCEESEYQRELKIKNEKK